MTRWASLVALGLCLFACEGTEITIFSANQAGSGGSSGNAGASAAAGASPAGAAGDTAGGSSSAAGGASGSASGGGAGGSVADPPCQSNADCDPGYFCSKQTCADVQGSCLLTGFPNETLDLQVCGCNNITYWNDSYRQQFGIEASTLGPCNAAPQTCMRDQDCGPTGDYRCEHLAAACGAPMQGGRCWVLPRHCPQPSATDSEYQVCPPPSGSGAPGPCVTKCEAIKSGHPFTELSQEQVCP